jgi:tol-pal system protein YbgF
MFPTSPLKRFAILPLALLALMPAACGGLGSKSAADGQPAERARRIEELTSEVQILQQKWTIFSREPGDPAGQATPPSAIHTLPAAEVERLYNEARARFVKDDFKGAAPIFQRIAEQAPSHVLAPNALYWLGECDYSQKHFDEAIRQFDRVVKNYPQSHKAPDAMLKIAYSYHMLGDGKSAMAHMRTLVETYPKSQAAMMVKGGQTLFRYP